MKSYTWAGLWVIVFSTVLTTAGCSATLPKQSFQKTPHIRSITIATPPSVREVSVHMRGHPARTFDAVGTPHFGLVGGMIAAVDMQRKTTQYNARIGRINWRAYAQQQLVQALQQAGYQTHTVHARPLNNFHATFLRERPHHAGDALLDYYFNLAHFAPGANAAYVPTINLDVRLTDANTHNILYAEQFTSGYTTDTTRVQLPATHHFPDHPALQQQTQQSTAALKQGIRHIAQQIAADLNNP